MTAPAAPRVGAIIMIEVVTAIGVLLFWIAFFTVGLAPADAPLGYHAFENAFPAPDIALAVTLLIAARFLRAADPRRQGAGRVLSCAAAGALMFLGLLDASFDLQNGMYTLSLFDGVLAAGINLWCVGAGLAILLLCRTLP